LLTAGWIWGCVSTVDSQGRTIWIADAYRDDGKRFVVRADEKLTAFVALNPGFALPIRQIKTNQFHYGIVGNPLRTLASIRGKTARQATEMLANCVFIFGVFHSLKFIKIQLVIGSAKKI